MKLTFLILALTCFLSCNRSINTKMMAHTNRLIEESSPYLLQHAHNPVNWYPWGDEAFEKAKKENKLVLVSIGYSACHWCHVMEKESFENEEVARIMNDYFVCIKVDREERPDVDKVYMDAVQILTGSGGWPLNCFALPDGKPVHGGTYFPKNTWISLLRQLYELYNKTPDQFIEQAKRLEKGVTENDLYLIDTTKGELTIDHKDIIEVVKPSFDMQDGGFTGAPKFPMPIVWEYLLTYSQLEEDPELSEAISFTLNKIANGGIYDHIGGGFARYSVDEEWHAPHFEKMLYDNAQLVSLYSHAYTISKNSYYKTIIEETLEFIEREMTTKEGAFFSAYDADSEGVEGKYYIWKAEEVEELTGSDFNLIADYYQISKYGNWENKENIFHAVKVPSEYSSEKNLDEEEFLQKIKRAKEILLKTRKKREKPLLDDKVLLSWNALMIMGYLDAFKAIHKKEYLETALINAEFILSKMSQKDGGFYRNYKNGKATIEGFLDDYAFTIEAFVSTYQLTFDEKWLIHADNLTKYVIENFYDNNTGLFFYTSKGKSRLPRKIEIIDNVIPSSNASMANNLKALSIFMGNHDYLSKAQKMKKTQVENLKHIRSFAKWGLNSLDNNYPTFEIVVVGKDFKKYLDEFQSYNLPNILYAGAKGKSDISILNNRYKSGKTLIYICQNSVCKLPVETFDEALNILKCNFRIPVYEEGN